MSGQEFYEKHFKINDISPTLTDVDRDYFELFDKLQKERIELIGISRGRTTNYLIVKNESNNHSR
jgi:hypothetical protein